MRVTILRKNSNRHYFFLVGTFFTVELHVQVWSLIFWRYVTIFWNVNHFWRQFFNRCFRIKNKEGKELEWIIWLSTVQYSTTNSGLHNLSIDRTILIVTLLIQYWETLRIGLNFIKNIISRSVLIGGLTASSIG